MAIHFDIGKKKNERTQHNYRTFQKVDALVSLPSGKSTSSPDDKGDAESTQKRRMKIGESLNAVAAASYLDQDRATERRPVS